MQQERRGLSDAETENDQFPDHLHHPGVDHDPVVLFHECYLSKDGGLDMKCPCKGCENRTVTCHGTCKGYQEWKQWHDEMNKVKAREQEALTDLPNACKKAWWKKLKQSI